MIQSFLRLFDEWVTDVQYTKKKQNITVKYQFKGCIFIGTSNLYQNEILNAFKRNKTVDEIDEIFRQANLKHPKPNSFSPEMLGRFKVIPFGPISRGDCYQKLLQKKLKLFIDELREEFNFREILLDNEQQILLALENKLYGEGTNIRKITFYFSDVRNLIQQRKAAWGNLAKDKLTICYDQGSVCIKIAIFLGSLNTYNNLATEKLP